MKRSYFAIGLIFMVLLLDQCLKIWVKLSMRMGEHFNVFGENADWFQIYFTENPGMAFGLELGGDYGKLALSLFRIVAVGFITYYLCILVKKKKSWGLIASISLIWAGAVGNILDSMFYGLVFTSSEHGIAQVTSFGSGYASFLYGKVVDMLYFPLIEGNYPSWFPFIGGRHFQFFQPIFNIADTSISVGVGMVIVFYRRFFKDLSDKTSIKEEELVSLNPTESEPTENENYNNKLPTAENTNYTDSDAAAHDERTDGIDIPMDEEPNETL